MTDSEFAWISRSNDQIEARLAHEDVDQVTIRVRRRGDTCPGTLISLDKPEFEMRYAPKPHPTTKDAR